MLLTPTLHPSQVMLPLDTVWLLERDGRAQPVLIREAAMEAALEMLRAAGVEGVMVDVWWGIVEHAGPQVYDFSAYRRLFEQVESKGLKIQVRSVEPRAVLVVGWQELHQDRTSPSQGAVLLQLSSK